jgi:hypothetical protein
MNKLHSVLMSCGNLWRRVRVYLIMAVLISPCAVYGYSYRQSLEAVQFTVDRRERVATGSGDSAQSYYLVWSREGEVFAVVDSWVFWRWDSSDRYGQLREGQSSIGIRCRLTLTVPVDVSQCDPNRGSAGGSRARLAREVTRPEESTRILNPTATGVGAEGQAQGLGGLPEVRGPRMLGANPGPRTVFQHAVNGQRFDTRFLSYARDGRGSVR